MGQKSSTASGPSRFAGQFQSLMMPLVGRGQKLARLGTGDEMQMQNFVRANNQGEPLVKILTYNVWFSEVQPERLDAVLKVIEEADADFVCLQEMTTQIYEYFMRNEYIRSVICNGGSVSPNEIGRYGTIIISKYQCHYFEQDFESYMGRKLIIAEPCVPFHLLVASSHFESLNQAQLRIGQLKVTTDLLKKAQGDLFKNHSVIVGDFNFDALEEPMRNHWMEQIQTNQAAIQKQETMHEEQVIMREGFEDMMHHFVDGQSFTMYQTPQFPQWRPDKVVMQRSPANDPRRPIWKCDNAQILGAESRPRFQDLGQQASMIVEDGQVRTPSDHMAILAELRYTDVVPFSGD